ncbi:MAG: YjjW family glycine radical enzyme activase [Erysipelotrichaceae bacterium]|nr:YjjW family glycine radical enzyme activase [Erysipelotrichaceae bacterium]MDD4642868.1 YjjW family glycine radical enzyme activase [Erysipelotrichaceae bacterium]
MSKAYINKIIDQSLVDGFGNRTAIFLQGCNLNCHYCHNPETINHCINCGLCVSTCPSHALSMINGKVVYDIDKCINCDTCIKLCPYDSSPKVQLLSVEEVFDHISKNIPFIRGITLSGGECTLNPVFIKELFALAKAEDLSTLLDSNGTYDFISDPSILKNCDGVMLDIKAYRDDDHFVLTDHHNQNIIENALYLAKIHKLKEIRTVIVFDDDKAKETVSNIAALLADHVETNNMTYKLIKYREYGVRKKYQNFKQPSDSLMSELKDIALVSGFKDVIII